MMRPVVLVVCGALSAVPAFAQTAVDRAIAAGEAVGGPEHLMNEEAVNDIVLPFETATPREGSMSHVQFEDEIANVREMDNVQGRSLRATEDGYQIRPGVDVDGQGPLFDDANWAHENAEDVAGHYFTSETGTCETVALPVTDITDQFCSAAPAEVSETCDLVRRIWVDRYDTYRCDQRAANYIEVCERANEYACHQASGQSGCLQQNVRFEGATSVTWNGDAATVYFAPSTTERFQVGRHTFRIAVSDHFTADEVRLTHVQAGGASQLMRFYDGRTRYEILETFVQGPVNGLGAGGFCPDDLESGLIVPTRFYVEGSECTPPNPAVMLGIYADYVQNGIDVSSRAFRVGTTVSTSGDNGFRCQRSGAPRACARFQTLEQSVNLERNLLRWLDVPAPTHPVPGAPKVWTETEFTFRIVAPPDLQYATLTFQFAGSCCDAFINVGAARCE